jgi:Fic family protein
VVQLLAKKLKQQNSDAMFISRAEGAGKLSQKIEVFDLQENTTTTYNSLSEAARALNIPRSSIRKNLQSKNSISYKGQYIFKLL